MASRSADQRAMAGRQRGLAIVEFAVTMPLVLFVLFATAEIGRALYQYSALTKAVRDGARYLATQGQATTGNLVLDGNALTRARQVTVFGRPVAAGTPVLPGFTVNNVTPRIRPGTFDYVEVSAVYTFQPVFAPLPTFGIGNGNIAAFTTFTAVAVQRSTR